MHAFLVARYVALTLFAICCIVVTAAAAWNTTETKAFAPTASILQVDVFLLVISICGLLTVFILVPIEILSKSAVTSRVWFEALWVATFWVFNFSGAVAVTATGPRDSCPSFTRFAAWKDSCVSSMVLQAFTWLSTLILLAYFAVFAVCTMMSTAGNSRIWQIAMRDVAWFAKTQQPIESGPSSPVIAAMREKQVPVYSIGVQPQAVLYQKYATSRDSLSEKSSTIPAPAIQRTRATEVVPSPQSQTDTPPLYPQFLGPRIQTQAVVQQGSSPLAGQWTGRSSDAPAQQSVASSPASTSSDSPTTSSPSSAGSGLKSLVLQASAVPASRPKPPSPRSKHRPPPLNLSGLSAFDSTGKRPDRAQRK